MLWRTSSRHYYIGLLEKAGLAGHGGTPLYISEEEIVIEAIIENLFASSIAGAFIKGVLPIGKKIYEKTSRKKLSDSDWIPRLNQYLEGEALVIQQIQKEPEIYLAGMHQFSTDQIALAKKHKVKNNKLKRPNDLHAILSKDPVFNANTVIFNANCLDFAGVCALRKEGHKPEILSSSAILFCNDTKEIILHRRAPDIDTYPNYLHTLGGAYIPTDIDRGGTRSTLDREIKEETQVSISSDITTPIMICKELRTGFIQVVYLGINLTPGSLELIKDNWEGQVVRVPFSDLASTLQRDDMVPSGKAHILAWLALGTPGTTHKIKFGKLSAAELFNQIVGVQQAATAVFADAPPLAP